MPTAKWTIMPNTPCDYKASFIMDIINATNTAF